MPDSYEFHNGRYTFRDDYFANWYQALFGEAPEGFEKNMLVQCVDAEDAGTLAPFGGVYPKSPGDWAEVAPKTWSQLLEDGRSAGAAFAMNAIANGAPAVKMEDQETGGEVVATLKTFVPFTAQGCRYSGGETAFVPVTDPVNWLLIAGSQGSNNWQVAGSRVGDGEIAFETVPGVHVAVVASVGKSIMLNSMAGGVAMQSPWLEVRLGMPLEFKVKAVRP